MFDRLRCHLNSAVRLVVYSVYMAVRQRMLLFDSYVDYSIVSSFQSHIN